MKIKAKHINSENFLKFGSIVIPPTCGPTSQAAGYKFWSDIAHYKINGATEIGICTVYKQPTNLITGMERHMLTPEFLIPFDSSFVLPVLVEGDKGSKAEAFQVRVGEAIIINQAVWHGACVPVGKNESTYFVIFRRKTPVEDVEKKNVIEIEIEI